MSKPPDTYAMQRLAFIRYMHGLGVEQAAMPEPLSWPAILTFHDAVELFLGLAATHYGADVQKDTKFVEYWKLIGTKITPARVPHSGRMSVLNDIRIGFKHHGSPPSPAMVEQASKDVATFFDAATPIVFGVAFDDIDLALVVPHEKAARYLRETQNAANNGEIPKAMLGLAVSFDVLMKHYSITETWRPTGRRFADEFNIVRRGEHANRIIPRDLGIHLDEMTTLVLGLQETQRILALGIDVPRYTAFKMLVPHVRRSVGSPGPGAVVSKAMREWLTIDHYTFCRTFVIESALKAAGAGEVARLRSEHRSLRSADGYASDFETITWNE